MATTTALYGLPVIAGGIFLIRDLKPADCFFPEDFTEDQKQVARTASEFAVNEVLAASDQIEAKDFSVTRLLIRSASALGLTSVDIPEEYGGLEMDKVTSAIVAENIAKQGSFSVTFSAHVGIGTLPLIWYGNEEQKRKYLPKLASGEFIGAYALSESSSGSDALNARTHAELSSDGQSYILNGEKMWITNAGFADIFTIFAMCEIKEGKDAGKKRLTAFLVERGSPGFTVGKEEHKLGIRGSSTCPIVLADCKIPSSNLLGEVGRGHQIAFNILNVGRYKLGNAAVGAAKRSIENGIRYAKERKAFGKSIAEFGLIQEKLANCAVGIFVGEALTYRTVGMIDAALANVGKQDMSAIQKVVEGYAVECSIVKVWTSEMLDRVVDDVVQIHGGYGYVDESLAERAYRDSRVNRIFEGTNEINRLIVIGGLIKQSISGKLALMPAIKQMMDDVLSGPSAATAGEGPLAQQFAMLASAKKLCLFAAGAAIQRHMQQLADQQEVMGGIADMVIEIYAMESAILRAEKMAPQSARIPVAMTQIYVAKGMERLELSARQVIAAVAEGDFLRTQSAILRRLVKHELTNTTLLRRNVAEHVIRAGKYAL